MKRHRKLGLHRETLRRLSAAQLAGAAGGEWVATLTCDPCVPQPVLSEALSGEYECACRVFSNDPRKC
jgi:hypothetical protein